MPKFNFILLAAGKSERMQSEKALLNFHGTAWINAQIKTIQKCAFIDQIYVVTNPDNRAAISAVIGKDIIVLENTKKDADTFSSILIGVRALPSDQGVFISPIDVPLVTEVIDQMIREGDLSGKAIIPQNASKKGHPVLLLSDAISELKDSKSPHNRLDFYLHSLPMGAVQLVSVDHAQISLNLNTPELWRAFTL